jgi:uncharacterized protein YjiS (DUF1127 family)
MIKTFWSRLKKRLLAFDAYYATHNDLGRLSDRNLADIGLKREDIEFYAIKAYYKSMEH